MKWLHIAVYVLLFNATFVFSETITRSIGIEVVDNKETPFSDTSLDLGFMNIKKTISVDTGNLLNEFF